VSAAGLSEGGLAPSAVVDDQAAVGVEAGTAGGCCDGSYHLSPLRGVCCGVRASSDNCSALHGSARHFFGCFCKGQLMIGGFMVVDVALLVSHGQRVWTVQR